MKYYYTVTNIEQIQDSKTQLSSLLLDKLYNLNLGYSGLYFK